MTLKSRLFAPLLAIAALLAPNALFAQQHEPTPQPVEAVPDTRVATPALWVVQDADTTIYLFGTIHLLPRGIDWYHGDLAKAFESADELVTEIPDGAEAEAPRLVMKYGMLPKGQSLRTGMNPAEKARFEKAMTGLGLPPAAFDSFKPWYAAVGLATLPLIREGYDPSYGVEAELAAKNKAMGRPRYGLETLDFQLGLFDQFSAEVQKQYLFEVIDGLPELSNQIDTMVNAWAAGDPTALASALNSDEDNPAMKEALITARNKSWAAWIRQRLDRPGVVFIAVGAGHLGGEGSVQDELAKAGIKSERVQ
ncbi:TraB/GumN family protein [Novosphingobium sp.]|uniref:TraB/GumN family protein n=1 Tax=Novosphingobium sp. TaxID=1874826 RepID=UPI0035AE7A2C